MGTRHRAAIGISEITDSWTIVVSEETGQVSLVAEGQIQHIDAENILREKLIKIMIKNNEADKDTNIDIISKIRDYINEKTNTTEQN